MTDLILAIGNKNYSSWSFRPWIALRQKNVPFTEQFIQFDFEAGNPAIKRVSPNGKVPLLIHGDLKVWDSLSILEYAAELFPERNFWPDDMGLRAEARSIAAEMHSSFFALRNACPMNMRRPVETLAVDDGVKADVKRILGLWDNALQRSGGPFLYGDFSNADAMYAPVVSRFLTYRLSTSPMFEAYAGAMTALPAWREWQEAALRETWIVAEDEI